MEHSQTSPTIVGIGASAGGLEAFTRLLGALPSNTGLAYVLVQHLAPDHQSLLPDLLRRAASIPIEQAHDGVRIEANHAYVIPPNTTMSVVDGNLHLVPRPADTRPHFAVDMFLSSLAEVHGAGAIAVILSGAGADGAQGVTAIKERGGITFAQDSQSAQHANMPEAAVATGCVDFILPPEQIAQQLSQIGQFVAQPSTRGRASGPDAPQTAEEDFQTIMRLVRKRSGVDFSQYRRGTVRRRIMRRMLVHRMESQRDYSALLRDNVEEVDNLHDDLLIGVTSFFRDADVFAELRETGFPELLRVRTAGAPLRIWVAGCSGGEETYSLAIALIEFLEETGNDVPVQIFGTDLSDTAIARARAGLYPESISAVVSVERLRRFFVADHGGYRIGKAVRDLCVFSRHNIVSDPPFSHLDLISCRNVLIYFEAALQRRVLPIFHYALKPQGLLLLGTAESTGSASALFEPLAKRHRLFRRREVPMRLLDLDIVAQNVIDDRAVRRTPRARAASPSSASQPPDVAAELDQLVLTHFAPRGVVINEKLEVVHFRGDTTGLLSHGSGTATFDLFHLARAELVTPLRMALTRARGDEQPAREKHVALADGDVVRHVTIDVLPLPRSTRPERSFVVLFSDDPPDTPSAEKAAARQRRGPRRAGGNETKELRLVRDELAATKAHLSELIEQHEATIEELRAVGEEVQSSNEELQSTNEELETTKEEIQSTNEELTTLNEELRHRNRELSEVASDLANVFASISIPIVILGRDHHLRRFTPSTNWIMRVIPSDVGRPFSDIKLSFTLSNLDKLISTAIETLEVSEHIVQAEGGRWWSLTIRPYQTVDRRVDGAVLVFNDVDASKRSHELAENTSEDRRRALVVADEARVSALARANEALAIGMADRQRAEVDRNALLRQLDSAQEEERRRLSRELHDEVGQHLTALGLGLQALSDVSPSGSEVDRRAEELRALANTLSRELHTIAVRLRPRVLDDFGLEAALSSYAQDWSAQTGIPLGVHAPLGAERLPPSVESAAFRIVQEALTNVAKHSHASRASVLIERRDGQLDVIVEDNGGGFEPAGVGIELGRAPGLGLLGIRERVSLLSGSVEIESAPGKGATLFVRLPVARAAEPGRTVDAGPAQ